jgi:drug/metabolite transporter (DMT)-like permease
MIVSGVFFGKLFYGERMTLVKVTSILLSFAGLFLIYSLDIDSSLAGFAYAGVLAGILTGVWNTLSKKFSQNYPALQLVGIDAAVSVAVSLMGALVIKESLPTLQLNLSWLTIVLFAVTHISAVGFVIYGFRHLEAQIGSIIMPTEIVFGALFGLFFFGEKLAPATLAGGVLIVTAAVMPCLVSLRNHD